MPREVARLHHRPVRSRLINRSYGSTRRDTRIQLPYTFTARFTCSASIPHRRRRLVSPPKTVRVARNKGLNWPYTLFGM